MASEEWLKSETNDSPWWRHLMVKAKVHQWAGLLQIQPPTYYQAGMTGNSKGEHSKFKVKWAPTHISRHAPVGMGGTTAAFPAVLRLDLLLPGYVKRISLSCYWVHQPCDKLPLWWGARIRMPPCNLAHPRQAAKECLRTGVSCMSTVSAVFPISIRADTSGNLPDWP